MLNYIITFYINNVKNKQNRLFAIDIKDVKYLNMFKINIYVNINISWMI